MMMRRFLRLSMRAQFSLLLVALIVVIAFAAAVVGRSLVISQTLNECRAVAQMVEHVGTWASKYGGVYVRTHGSHSIDPGTFLERRSYVASAGDAQLLAGYLVPQSAERQVLDDMETYHSKNPALIQREISDVASASTAPVKFRITARSVLNQGNAPNAFEREAIDAIDSEFEREPDDVSPNPRPREYSKVEGGQLLYARAMIASPSCLKCHGSRESAPAFLTSNPQFGGGGGFGYEAGRPAGIISVSVPLPHPAAALASSLTPGGWGALAAVLVAALLFLAFVVRYFIVPVNRLRVFADQLADAPLGQAFEVPVPDVTHADEASGNEVHRLARSISRLGHSLKYVYGKIHDKR
jgi:hypothetical protein